MQVVATDNGSPRQRSSSATVNVNILDKNNKSPSFTAALYTTTVSEGKSAKYGFLSSQISLIQSVLVLQRSFLKSLISEKK